MLESEARDYRRVFAAESEWHPALELLMKISARSPFGKREKVAQ